MMKTIVKSDYFVSKKLISLFCCVIHQHELFSIRSSFTHVFAHSILSSSKNDVVGYISHLLSYISRHRFSMFRKLIFFRYVMVHRINGPQNIGNTLFFSITFMGVLESILELSRNIMMHPRPDYYSILTSFYYNNCEQVLKP